jgi:RimJ/RimL family protein N-acetyltransferase
MTAGAHRVPGEERSYLIAIEGHFVGVRPAPPRLRRDPPETMSWSVQMLVVDAVTGRVTDFGGSNDYPDLAAMGEVVTDYRAVGLELPPASPYLPYTFVSPLPTERLILRTMTPVDVDDVHSYQSRADVCRYLPFEPRSRDEVAERVARHATAVVLASDDDYWQLAIELGREPGCVIGDIYFCLKSVANASGEMGWTLHPDHSGNGYMTEAAGAVMKLAFREVGLHRVSAQLDPRNRSSAALCERLGMRREAHFHEDLWFKGEWGDTAAFAILDRDWASRTGR